MQRSVGLVLVVGIAVGAAVGVVIFEQRSTVGATPPVGLGHERPLGEESAVVPASPTPIAAPSGATLITSEKAMSIAKAWVSSGGTADNQTFTATLSTNMKIPGFRQRAYAPDYPIWSVSASGTFHRSFGGPPGNKAPDEYHSITVFVDAVTGRTLGEELRPN